MIIYTIYKIVNKINGKVYIGFSVNFEKRMMDHQHAAKTEKNKFYNAIRKYGWDNFVSEIIYQSKDGQFTLNVMENYFIVEYDSYNNGYNSTLGGEGIIGYKHSQQTKQKLSRPLSEEHKEKLKISRRKRKVEPALGKKWSDSRREKFIASRKGKENVKAQKQLKTPDGIFNSVTLAAEYYGHNIYYMSRKIRKNPDKFQFVKQEV